MTAARSGIHLTNADAAKIKGMIARGDRQHDIAAYFGVNGGRIGEISKGHTFSGVAMQSIDLPPPGPYLTPVAMAAMRAKLLRAKDALTKALPSAGPSASDVQAALSEVESSLIDLKKK